MTEINKPCNSLKTILFKSPWSVSFSFIITALLVLLTFVNIVLFAFFGMQINSMVFLILSLVSFVFVLISSFETATAGRTTVNWVMFLITAAAVVIAALTTGFFKNVPKVELDNISNTLIALTFGCTVILTLYNNLNPIESISGKDPEEVSPEASEDTALETSEEAEEDASQETKEEEQAVTKSETSEEKIATDEISKENKED